MTAASPNRLRKQATKFTMVPNELLRDTEISLKAKGLYALMFSKPDGWTFYEAALVEESRDGKDAVSAGLAELVGRGWLKRDRSKNETGRFGAYDYEICTHLDQGGFSAAEKPLRENRSGKPATSNTETVDTEKETPKAPKGPCAWEDDKGFMSVIDAFRAVRADRVDLKRAWDVWEREGFPDRCEAILNAVAVMKAKEDWKKEAGRYVPRLSRFLFERNWMVVSKDMLPAGDLAAERARRQTEREAHYEAERKKRMGF